MYFSTKEKVNLVNIPKINLDALSRADAAHIRRVEAAMDEASRLVSQYGQFHPRAMMAIIAAVNLADPDFAERAAEASGIVLPSPSHFSLEGEPLFSTEDIAAAFNEPHAEVLKQVSELEEAGLVVPVSTMYRVQ